MPVDDYGNVAEVITDGASAINRMCFGRFSEHFINYTAAHYENIIFNLYKSGKKDEALDMLMDFYKVASPKMYEYALMEYTTREQFMEHLHELVYKTKMLRLWIPTDSPNMGAQAVKDLIDNFPVQATPVTYIDDNGRKVRTTKPVRIGSSYLLLLEKMGDEWGATSLPKRQHHGIPGKLTDGDKASLPWRDQAFRIFGESEIRLMMGTLEPAFVASVMNFANSPAACSEAAETILTAKQPGNMNMAYDYRKHADMPGRATQYFNHVLNISGIEIARGDSIDEK